MSVTPSPRDLSNHPQRPWVVVVILVLMLWAPFAHAVGAYVDAAALIALFSADCGTAAEYSNCISRV